MKTDWIVRIGDAVMLSSPNDFRVVTLAQDYTIDVSSQAVQAPLRFFQKLFGRLVVMGLQVEEHISMGILALVGLIQYLVRYRNAAVFLLPPLFRTKADEQPTAWLLRISLGSEVLDDVDEALVRAVERIFEVDRQELSEERTGQQASLGTF